jgi:hypothetical protein
MSKWPLAETRRRKATKLKRRKKPTAERSRGSSAADLQEQLDLCTRELNEANKKLSLRTRELSEAQDQLTATSEVLRVISNSPTDLQSALGAIAESAARLLDVTDAEITNLEGDGLRLMAKHGSSRQRPVGSVRPITRGLVIGRAVIDRTTVQVPDLQAAESDFPEGAASARQYGHRTTLATPLLREGLLRLEPTADIYLSSISLRAGFWLPKLAEEIAATDAFLLLIGPGGVGPWQVCRSCCELRDARRFF